MHTRIKICGITRLEDAQVAVAAGTDALGLVFYPDSPRYLPTAAAAAIAARIPPFVTRVGLFVNADATAVRAVLDQVALDCLQFHGDEPAEFCAQFQRPYLKAIRMRPEMDVMAAIQRYATAQGILLDTYNPQYYGGTGQSFDWSRIPHNLPAALILAGGLTPDNVAAAVRQIRPYAVDVSGGVEASKGIKDHAKLRAFIREVRALDGN